MKQKFNSDEEVLANIEMQLAQAGLYEQNTGKGTTEIVALLIKASPPPVRGEEVKGDETA